MFPYVAADLFDGSLSLSVSLWDICNLRVLLGQFLTHVVLLDSDSRDIRCASLHILDQHQSALSLTIPLINLYGLVVVLSRSISVYG